MSRLPSSVHKQMYDFLDGLLRHKSDMVNIEAARAICDMKGVTPQELYRPVAGAYEVLRYRRVSYVLIARYL
jgi:hypothetical protein